MTLLRTALMLLASWLPAPETGRAYYYDPGMFAQVARNRGMRLAWNAVDGFASTRDCAKVDVRRPWVVWAQIDGGPIESYQIVDCSAPRDVARHRRIGLVLEVDYATAARQRLQGRPRLRLDGKAPAAILGYSRLSVQP